MGKREGGERERTGAALGPGGKVKGAPPPSDHPSALPVPQADVRCETRLAPLAERRQEEATLLGSITPSEAQQFGV